MLWVVQRNLFSDNRRGDLLRALDRLGCPVAEVDVARGEIQGEAFDEGQPILTNGSVMLSKIARDRGWSPGSFLNENFDFAAWGSRYADLLLNRDARSCALADAELPGESAFVRPELDDKSFGGRVFSRAEFEALREASLRGEKTAPKPSTRILMAAPKKIGQEHRHYVVDGEVVTSSRYKLSGQPNFQEGADDDVLALARQAISRWTPARAFVLDTCVGAEGVFVVELGCVAHAGLYACDVLKLAHRLDSMEPDPAPAPRARPSA